MMAEIIYGSAFSPFTFLHQENIYAHLLSHRGDKVQVPVTLTLKVWLTIMNYLVANNQEKAPIIMDAFSLRRGHVTLIRLAMIRMRGKKPMNEVNLLSFYNKCFDRCNIFAYFAQ